jgi:sRNA-binding carbon storage regulator CsrA
MLMLTRRRGESVDIYDKNGKVVVTVSVAEFLPNNVIRLGFAASSEYTILRDNAKLREQKDVVSVQEQRVPTSAEVTYKKPRRT